VIGTLVNVAAILAGGIAGMSLHREPSPRHQFFLKTVLGVLSIYTGFRMLWQSIGGTFGRVLLQLAIALGALVLGNLLGKALRLQKQSNRLGQYARERFSQARTQGKAQAGDGFVTCTILFCVGPMSILGALQEGLRQDPTILLIKAAMDGLAALAFVRVFGGGVLISALPVLAYQGTLTLAARALRPLLESPAMLDGICAVGGLLVASTSLVILDVRKVPLADYLPALIVGPILWRLLG